LLAVTFLILLPNAALAQQPVDSIAGVAVCPKGGQISVSGTFTVAKGATLTNIAIWAYPTNGGTISSTTATAAQANVDATKLTWGPILLDTNIYANLYSIRVDGKFSDSAQLISSAYTNLQTQGGVKDPANVTLSYSPGYPSVGKLTISLAGQYTGLPSQNQAGPIAVSPVGGGVLNPSAGNVQTTPGPGNPPPAFGSWVSQQPPAAPVTVPAAGAYTVAAWVMDTKNAKLFYCAPVTTVQVPATAPN
jgi:hypothetical protein